MKITPRYLVPGAIVTAAALVAIVAEIRDDRSLPSLETAHELIVLVHDALPREVEEMEPIQEGAVIKDAKLSDQPFEGDGTNGTIGIGGGSGGAYGGRRGGRRNLRAGGGGRATMAGFGAYQGVFAAPQVGCLRAGEREFPLKHTHVEADVGGWLSRTRVLQSFENPFDDPVEAEYVFPLPADSAVHGFEMRIRGRTIVGVIRKREEARRIYEEARKRAVTRASIPALRTASI